MNGCKVRNNYKNKDEKKRRYGIMKYVCDLCGWEYDEEIEKDQFSNAE